MIADHCEYIYKHLTVFFTRLHLVFSTCNNINIQVSYLFVSVMFYSFQQLNKCQFIENKHIEKDIENLKVKTGVAFSFIIFFNRKTLLTGLNGVFYSPHCQDLELVIIFVDELRHRAESLCSHQWADVPIF